jgi:large subunit ribosomal protein L35
MPKMKTHRGAAKRFKAKKNGIKRGSAFRSHILTKYSPSAKRGFRAPKEVSKADEKGVKAMLAI